MAKQIFNPDFIEKIAHACIDGNEILIRAVYYDCAPYSGTVKMPVSGNIITIAADDKWLDALAEKNLFAVRRGVLKSGASNPSAF